MAILFWCQMEKILNNQIRKWYSRDKTYFLIVLEVFEYSNPFDSVHIKWLNRPSSFFPEYERKSFSWVSNFTHLSED
jgi:hypothetical protein